MDYYSDQGHLLAKLFHTKEMPDYAKLTKEASEEELGLLPDSSFADPVRRQFPIHNKGNTYISAAYAFAQPKVAAEISENIRKAAVLWGIEKDLEGMVTTQKTASVDNIEFCELTGKRVYGISGPFSAKIAADDFLDGYQKFQFADRTKIATFLVRKLNEFGESVPEDLFKFAGEALPHVGWLQDNIKARAMFLMDDDKKVELSKVAEEIASHPEPTMEGAMKVAEFLDEFDRDNNLIRFYTRGLLDPHRSVFQVNMKTAESITRIVKLGDFEISAYKLPNPYNPIYEIALGKDRAKQASQAEDMVAFVESLTDLEKKILAQHLA